MKRILVKIDGEWQEWEVQDLVVLSDKRQVRKIIHPTQEALVVLSQEMDISKLTLREIGLNAGVGDHPQKVKHHLDQLVIKGFLEKKNGKYSTPQTTEENT